MSVVEGSLPSFASCDPVEEERAKEVTSVIQKQAGRYVQIIGNLKKLQQDQTFVKRFLFARKMCQIVDKYYFDPRIKKALLEKLKIIEQAYQTSLVEETRRNCPLHTPTAKFFNLGKDNSNSLTSEELNFLQECDKTMFGLADPTGEFHPEQEMFSLDVEEEKFVQECESTWEKQ